MLWCSTVTLEEMTMLTIKQLTFANLWANLADDKLIFFLFLPLETICMKCQILFSGKNRKNISKCCLLKFFTQNVFKCIWASADSKGPDQSVHLHSLIRAFAVHKKNHWIR